MVTFEEGPKIDTCLTRAFLDARQLAKRMLSILPPLPDWMAPRQVHVIDAIYQIGLRQDGVRPSDVARFLEGTMPSVTRMLTTLEEHGAIERRPAADDKRSHTLVLTPYGQELYDVHVAQFHEHLTELFADIPERDICVTVAVIEETWERLKDDNFKLPLSDSKEV